MFNTNNNTNNNNNDITNTNINTNINSELIRELLTYLRQQQTYYSNISHDQHSITESVVNLISNTVINSSNTNNNAYQWQHNTMPLRQPFNFRRNHSHNEGIFRRRFRTNNNFPFRRDNRQSPIRVPERDNTNLPNLPNLQTFINNTLFSSNRRLYRPTIRNIINNISIHIWRNIKNDNNITQETCPIAVRRFEDDDIVAKINNCQHCFLYDKLLEWFDNDNRCPICRFNISSLITPIDTSSNTLSISQPNSIDLSNNFTQTDLSSNIIAEFSFNIPPNLNLRHLFESTEPPTAFDDADDTGV
jgi:hypothetical protein